MEPNEPDARWGHSSVSVGGKTYVWSGCTKDLPGSHSSPEKTRHLSKVFVFDIQQSQWSRQEASGSIPPAVRGSATATDDSARIFNFGGYCGHGYCWYNSLHVLHFKNNCYWEEKSASICIGTSTGLPMKKQDCGMVHFKLDEYECLCVVGGAGKRDSDDDEWLCTNEVHTYNLKDGMYMATLYT